MKRNDFICLCFELNDFIYSEHFKSLEIQHYVFYNILKALFLFITSIIRDLIKNKLKFHPLSYYYKLYNNKNIFFSPTLNNLRSVENIEKLVDNSYHITDLNKSKQYPNFHVYLYSFLYIFPIVKMYINMKKGKEKTITGNALYKYILTSGYYIVSCKLCINSSIRSLILSNDHNFFNRAFIKAAQQHKIKSLYTQHASVADYYPQLSCTFSILDGLDSMKKYASSGKSLQDTTILLLGAARYDFLVSNKKEKMHCIKNRTIGLGINALDDLEIITDICNRILSDFPGNKIIVRAHPNWSKPRIQNQRIVWTSALEETIDLFFSKIDILISNDSCIHFDAIKYGTPTVMYTLSKNGFSDQYNFVSSKFVKYITDYNSLAEYLKVEKYYFPEASIVREYDNSYKKLYEGNISAIIADFINSNYDLNYLTKKYKLEKSQTDIGIYYQIL